METPSAGGFAAQRAYLACLEVPPETRMGCLFCLPPYSLADSIRALRHAALKAACFATCDLRLALSCPN